MGNPLDDIWTGDKLQRRDEARLLERFLASEAQALAAMGRDQAFVLALDAQYGEGKSWFLNRLRRQLCINHPVAFVDAWVDDANNEPLVAVMAALDEALQPFLTKTNVREKLGDLTRAALPIMGKAILGAGGKFVSKYVGEEFGDDAKEVVASVGRMKPSPPKNDDSALQTGIDKLFDGVSEVVDNAGKALLDQYRARKRSRNGFKANLRQLAETIRPDAENSQQSPIFIIVDELDRCRPSYAISLLEEIKHLFDVPGIVFLIALHEDQLEHSVRAVYGEGFDARSYLRRFFTRHYELRRLSIKELVISHFEAISPNVNFSSPEVWLHNAAGHMRPSELAGSLLSEWGSTPREAQAIVDALRLFCANWDHPNVPIELPLVLALLLNLVRGEDLQTAQPSVRDPEVFFFSRSTLPDHSNNGPSRVSAHQLSDVYNAGISSNLVAMSTTNYNGGLYVYLPVVARSELNTRFNGRYSLGNEPKSTWVEYRDRVREVGRFVEVASPE